MQTSSREFAKKNGEMDSHLAIDETHFSRRSRAAECSDDSPRAPPSRDLSAGTSMKMQGNRALPAFAERRENTVCGAHRRAPDSPSQRARKARTHTRRFISSQGARDGLESLQRRQGTGSAATTPMRESQRDGARRKLLLVPSALQELSLLVLSHLLAALLDHTTHWKSPCSARTRRAGFEVSSGRSHRTRSSE